MRRSRAICAALTLVIGSSVLTLALGEVLLRLIRPQPLYSFEKDTFSSSADFGYSLTPKTVKHHTQPEYSYMIKSNAYGFRGKDPNFRARHRILILGDSMGMGQGVNEGKNLCDLAQFHFDGTMPAVDIFNTSISGYSGINQIAVLRRFIGNYNPSLVVLLFCWNDLGAADSLKVRNGYLVLSQDDQVTAPLREWLNNHSHLYCLIKRFYYTLKERHVASPLPEGGILGEDGISATLRVLKEMKSMTEAHQGNFLLVLLPLDAVVDPSPFFNDQKMRFSERLRKERIKFEDWGLVLPRSGREGLAYKIDRHWTEKGHEYFSQFLIRIIELSIQNEALKRGTL